MHRQMEKQPKKEVQLPPHTYEPPCIKPASLLEPVTPGKIPPYYNSLPRDCKFAYMTPGYYATGYRILDVYKTEIDFSEIRRLLFLEDSKEAKKWAVLKLRIPYAPGRVTELPGTSDLNYKNYCLRNLTPESAASWRKSIVKSSPLTEHDVASENTQKDEEDCIFDKKSEIS